MFYTGRTYQGAQGHIYPYPMSDKLTDERKDVTYKAVYVENEYTKLCVLPEIGGRLFQALDKTNNFNFFYKQDVIKPALIGMLGAWISGGVEWNIPHHHRASTYLPVDYKMVENPDSSKTIWVGETELRNRLKWSVGLTLYPDRSYIEATVRIVNTTPFAQSFLYWANVSVHSNKDYQIIFPPSTQYGVGHAKNSFINWPVGTKKYGRTDLTGVDVSWWKNHPNSNSIFAWNFQDDFLAGYDHGLKAGTVHVANHHFVGGKKFFLWGNNEESRMWDKILTEKDGPYTELMVGAFSDNQPDYSWIAPGEVRVFKQYWFPVSKIGGVKYANTDAAINLEIIDNKASIGIQTTKRFNGAKILLKIAGKTQFEKTTTIDPATPYLTEVSLPNATNQYEVELTLTDSAGKTLLTYKPVEYAKEDMPKPVEPPKNPKDYTSVEELYYTGLRLEQFYNGTTDPMPYYKEALLRDSLDYRTNTILGVHYLKNGMVSESEMYFRRAIKRITKNYTMPKDGEAFYYLGVLLKYDNRLNEAIDFLYKACWFSGFQSPAYAALAEINITIGNFDEALKLIDEAIKTNADNQKLIALKAGILRKLNRNTEAISYLKQNQARDVLDFRSNAELYLCQLQARNEVDAKTSWNELMTISRGDSQTWLELASEYDDCGLWQDGLQLLQMFINTGINESKNPEIFYYAGYFAEKTGNTVEAKNWYAKGSSFSTDYCFPFRLEALRVLTKGRELLPKDAKIAYCLGELYCFFRQFDAAVQLWKDAIANDPDFSMAYRNLGFVYSKYKDDYSTAIDYYEKAFKLNNSDSRLLFELDELYKVSNENPLNRLAKLETNLYTVEKRDETLLNLIQLYIQEGKYDKALAYLNTRHFHVWEGGGDVHGIIYRDALLLRGLNFLNDKKYENALEDFKKALTFPDNLEVGRPALDARSAQVCYYIGIAYENLGNKTEANKMFLKAADLAIDERPDYTFFKAKALEKIGKKADADKLYQKLEEYCNENINSNEGLDFFEKFGSDMSKNTKKARLHYLLGLAKLGMNNNASAKSEFELALKMNINHVWAKNMLKTITTP